MTEIQLSNPDSPWWMNDSFTVEEPVPTGILDLAGPMGTALVRAWPDGRTDVGWGLIGPMNDRERGFLPRYMNDDFNLRSVLFGYRKDRWAFAVIMRSVKLVCIDIDGKNGGFEHAKRLGVLPPTLAETSKSGNGFHLFYEVDDEWDETVGFGAFPDRIGIETGVDIRGTGCVYHYSQQRWNGREPVKLPSHLATTMLTHRMRQSENRERASKVLSTGDKVEILMMQTEIEKDLAKDIPAGRRNNTLFAIGQRMKEADIADWEAKLEKRAMDLGLDSDEASKLSENVSKYN